MPKTPVLHFFPSDYIGDTRHLSVTEHGAYMLLIFAAWMTEDCSLPNDETRLARMAGCNLKQWRRISGTILAFWDLDEGRQKWTQKRLLKEHQKATLKSDQARRSAYAKHRKDKKTGSADALRTHSERSANHNHNHNHKKKRADALKKEKPPAAPAVRDKGFKNWWEKYPRKVGEKEAEVAFARALNKTDLETLIAGAEALIAAAPWGDNLRYCPKPATWLDGERWSDRYDDNGNPQPPPGLAGDDLLDWWEQQLGAKPNGNGHANPAATADSDQQPEPGHGQPGAAIHRA